MIDFSQLLIASAFAQEAAPAADSTQPILASYFPFILIFLVFYFLVIRPQQKKLSEQDKMIQALQRGDRVVTTGGIHGKIAKIEEAGVLMLEIAEGVTIKIERSHVGALAVKPQPVVIEGDKK